MCAKIMRKQNKKYNALIVYIGIGHGFKSPALAICTELSHLGIEPKLSDVFADLKLNFLDSFIKKGWKLCLKHPLLFDIIYNGANNKFRFESVILSYVENKILKQIEEFKPDLIVSTHFSTTYLYSKVVKRHSLGIPVFAYNSDVVTAHNYWISNDVAAYFVPTEDGYLEMLKLGQHKQILHKSSFPIDRKFKRHYSSLKEERRKLSLKNKFTVLLVFGGEGIGNASEFIQKLELEKVPVQVIAICGANESMKKQLEAMRTNLRNIDLIVNGFTINMQDYIYCSDVVLGKAGLNLVFECIFMKRPFIVNMAMANEKFAARYILKNKIGYWPKTTSDAVKLLKELGDEGKGKKKLEEIKQNLNNMRISFNTEDIAKEILLFTDNFKNK